MSRLIDITIFPDVRASTFSVEKMTLTALRDDILATSAPSKEKLPLLKLATFGKAKTAKGCLRHDANVLTISGVELDYDSGTMSYDEARDRLAAADLNALLYTSPSHTETRPRWRVLAPASRNDLAPEVRRALVARINGVLGGICAPESFTLSQAFYYGSVDSNADHRAEIVDGDFVDLLDDLDAGAIGNDKPNSEDKEAFEWVFDIAATGYMDAEVEEVLAEPPVKGTRSTRFAYAVKLAVERGMTAADFEALCREHPDGPAGKYLIKRSDLRKRIGELWAPHAAAFAAKKAKQEAPQNASIIQIGAWVRGQTGSPDPLVEDGYGGEIIGRSQQGILYGAFGTLKTAIANEFHLAVATGLGMGRQALVKEPLFRAQKGRVLTAIYEDPRDNMRRALALAKARNVVLDDLDWAILSADLDITKDQDRVVLLKRIADDAAKCGPPALLTIDTATAAVGSKSLNNDDVVGMLFTFSGALVRTYGCTTIFVMHPGKDESRGPSGTNRQYGNADFILHTIELKNGDYRLLKEKERGGAKRPLFDFRGQFVEVEQTSGGAWRTGAIIGHMELCPQESHPQHTDAKRAAKSTWTRRLQPVRKSIIEALTKHGTDHQIGGQGAKVRAVAIERAREIHKKIYVSTGDGDRTDAERNAWKRNFKIALEADLIGAERWSDEEVVWLSEPFVIPKT